MSRMFTLYPQFKENIKDDKSYYTQQDYYNNIYCNAGDIIADIAQRGQATVAKDLHMTQTKLSSMSYMLEEIHDDRVHYHWTRQLETELYRLDHFIEFNEDLIPSPHVNTLLLIPDLRASIINTLASMKISANDLDILIVNHSAEELESLIKRLATLKEIADE